MKDLLHNFCDMFPSISFDVKLGEIKNKLSLETSSAGEREIKRMLKEAKRQLSKFKKLHKQGKVGSEEVFDCDWRVHELELELERFIESTELDNELGDFGEEDGDLEDIQ